MTKPGQESFAAQMNSMANSAFGKLTRFRGVFSNDIGIDLGTANTLEEKIMEMQNRKRGLVKKVVSTDEEAISKLTWEEVLELLQT